MQQINFQTIDRDYEKILGKLFSNQNLLKLLYYNTPDALNKQNISDNNIIKDISNYCIKISPSLEIPKEKHSFIMIQFDNFQPNFSNPQFIDNDIFFDILCPNEKEIMILDHYMLRPQLIMHEIDSMFNQKKLNGIGTVSFIGASAINLNDYYGYRMVYNVINNV